MRLFFTGPRVMGIRPGISFDPGRFISGPSQRQPGKPAGASFVYVVRGDHQMVKIGVTTNPDARMAQLRTGSAFPIAYAYLGMTPGAGYDIEQEAHAILAAHRVNGEWFDCPADVAVAAVAAAAFRTGQQLAQVDPGKAADILRLAAARQSPGNATPHAVWRGAQIAIGAGLGTILVLFLAIIVSAFRGHP